jgi:5S rRNA maturation endonuclease (ribonuclease M5)
MKYNQNLKNEIEKYKSYVILVEGKKDVAAIKSAGFEKVHAIHQTSVSLRERIEQISQLIEKKEKVCILTDLDRRGKELYLKIMPILQELGIEVDSNFRGILIRAGISHIEGIYNFFNKVDNI